jgi:demethylmenaquinone methyltransferase/2-methoxy-6-polyprenyl-1,4-benzoquinol methylase
MRDIVPRLARMTSRTAGQRQRELWAYYWDTIDACVPAQAIQDAMASAGFESVRRHVEWGLFSEYTGRKR